MQLMSELIAYLQALITMTLLRPTRGPFLPSTTFLGTQLLKFRGCRKDYYDVLQLPKGASESQIKRSYRKLALQYHPVGPMLYTDDLLSYKVQVQGRPVSRHLYSWLSVTRH